LTLIIDITLTMIFIDSWLRLITISSAGHSFADFTPAELHDAASADTPAARLYFATADFAADYANSFSATD
jgi:hypothetical protein